MTRIVLALTGTAFALALAACGGGGGESGPAPAEKVELTVTRTPAPETVSNDFVSKDVAFGGEVAATGATSVTLTLEPTCGGVKLDPTTQTLTATGGPFSVRSSTPLTEGTLCEVVVKAIATGASGQGTENSVVLKVYVAAQSDTIPAYEKVGIAIYDGSPAILSRTAPFALEVANHTGLAYQWGAALGEEPTKDGHVLILSGWFSEDTGLRVTQVNPVKGVQTAYMGPLPPGYEFNATGDPSTWTWGTKWHWCMSASCPPGSGGPWGTPPDAQGYKAWSIDREGGHFYAPFDRFNELWYLDSGGVRTLLMPGRLTVLGSHMLITVMGTYTYTPTSE